MSFKDFYFSHDCHALNDEKIIDMRSIYGMEGYGLFWALLESMSCDSNQSLLYSERRFASLKNIWQISFDVKAFVDSCIEIGLFVSDGERYWSESLRRRRAEMEEKSNARSAHAKKAIEARWKNKQQDENTPSILEKYSSNTQEYSAIPIKSNKIKSNKIKENNLLLDSAEQNQSTENADGADDIVVYDPLVAYASNNLQYLSPTNMEELLSYRDTLPDDMIQFAIDQACANGARRYSYVHQILNNYIEKEFKSVGDVKAYMDRRAKAKNSKHNKMDQPTIVPTGTSRIIDYDD